MIKSAKRCGRILAAAIMISSSWTSAVMAQAAISRDTTQPLVDPYAAIVTAARYGSDEPPVRVTTIDGVTQDVPRTGFLHLFVSSDEQSYSVPAGLHVFYVQYFADRINHIDHVKVLTLKGHHYKFFYDGHELRYQDVTGNGLREIPLHQQIMTGASPAGSGATVIINIINPPRTTAPPLSAYAPRGNANMPVAMPTIQAQPYSSWTQQNPSDGRNAPP